MKLGKWWQKCESSDADWKSIVDKVKSATNWLDWDRTYKSVKTMNGELITHYWTETKFKEWGIISLAIITFEKDGQYGKVKFALHRTGKFSVVVSEENTEKVTADDFEDAQKLFEALVEGVKSLDCSEVAKEVNMYRIYKRLADSTLKAMRKDELIHYIRVLENNCDAVVERNEQQVKNFAIIKKEIVSDITIELEKKQYRDVYG